MLRSRFCVLHESSEKDLMNLGECPSDQGGYFIINGSEKVLIAQERMSSNQVYVFQKKQPHKYSYVAEVRYMGEKANRPPSGMFVRMLSKASARAVRGWGWGWGLASWCETGESGVRLEFLPESGS